ncbi:WxL domain-containing protein, partial [Enterococcus faecalis]
MKKQILASVALSALALSMGTQSASAFEISSQDIQADVTLKTGSGKDVKPVVDPTGDTDEDPATGGEGALSIPYASSISFGEQEIQQGDATYFAQNEKPFVQVNDTRGGAEGWTLVAAISEFKGAKNQNVLKGAQLTLANGQVTTENNQSEAPTIASANLTLNDSPQPLMSAEKGKGAGAWAALFQG